MKRLVMSKISTKLLCAVMLVLVITLGITSLLISKKVNQTFVNTVVNDISVSVDLLADSVDMYTQTLSGQMSTQLDSMLAMYPGELTVNYDQRIKTDGDYRAPIIKKGDVILNEQLADFAALAQATGYGPTLFVWDKDSKGEYDFLRTMTTLKVSDNSVYGKPLFIPADKRADVLAGKTVYYTMSLYGNVYIGITYPLMDKNGKLLGAITTSTVLDNALTEMQKKYTSMHIGGDSGYLYIMDAAGNFLVHPSLRGTSSLELVDKDGNKFMQDILAAKNGQTEYSMPASDGKFDNRIAIFKEIPSLHWIVGASIKESDVTQASSQVGKTLIVAIVLTILIIMVVIRFTVRRFVSVPLAKMSAVFECMAQGDFSNNIGSSSADEIGDISRNLNTTLIKLNSLFSMLKNAAVEVNTSAQSVGDANAEMANSAIRQSESATVMSAAIEELEYSIREMSTNVETTSVEAGQIKETAESGEQVLVATVGKINSLSDAVISSSTNVDALAQSVEKIANVLGVIDDIADQTNLLALNAAIEAARAGDAGRGFAVVADEVRKLAEKTVDATREISTMIATINTDVKSTIDVMQEGVDMAKETGESTSGLAAEIKSIIDGVISISDKVAGMVAIIHQQTEATSNTIVQVQAVAASADENNSMAQENVEKVEALKEVALHLNESISSFKLRQSLVEWTPAISVGVSRFDEEHKRLIELINELNSNLGGEQGKAGIGQVLNELINYTTTHFKGEEEQMQRLEYPDYESHKKVHDGFVAKAQKLQQDYKSGKAMLGPEMVKFLSDWVVNHIQKLDTRYTQFFNEKGLK